MLCRAILTWTLVLPAALAVYIETHYRTSSDTTCFTSYGTTSLESVPTSSVQRTVNKVPVMLHNSTTYTTSVTPKPISTYYSLLETSTAWVTQTPVNGTFVSTFTKFRTSTYWHHTSITVTKTKYRYKTSRTTTWIPTSTGFLPIWNTTSSKYPDTENKREIGHPHAGLSARQNSQEFKLRSPAASNYPISVNCVENIALQTTEVMLLPETKLATVTLTPETLYKTKTVWGTLTSTVLSIPASIDERDITSSKSTTSSVTETSSTTSASESPSTSNSVSSTPMTTIPSSPTSTPSTTESPSTTTAQTTTSPTSTTPILKTGTDGIVTNIHLTTKTPYTITFTWTATTTSTATSTRHATTTLTSHAACSTANILSSTSKNRRINSLSILKGSPSLQKLVVENAGLCCEACMSVQGCTWSFFEADGRGKGNCWVFFVGGEEVEKGYQGGYGGEDEEDEEFGRWGQRDCHSVYGFSAALGEERYVVSNGEFGFVGDREEL